jgi:hypothetical protein
MRTLPGNIRFDKSSQKKMKLCEKGKFWLYKNDISKKIKAKFRENRIFFTVYILCLIES